MAALLFACHSEVLAAAEGAASQVLITYRCRPADRPAFRDQLERNGAARLQAWKRQGVVADYLLLFNGYVNQGAWDAMAMLNFDGPAQLARWTAIERASPGGLSPEEAKLAWPVATSLGREFRRAASPSAASPPPAAVFVVMASQHDDRRAYEEYVDAYRVPEFKGWLDSGALLAFRVHVDDDERAAPTGVVVLEYPSLEALARGSPAAARLRVSRPARGPSARAEDDAFREGAVVLADRILAR